MIDEKTQRRKRPVYFWDEDLYKKHKSKFLFKKPILFCQHTNGKLWPVFQGEHVDSNKYTGEKLRQLRAERGVGRPPRIVAEKRANLLEGMQA